MADTVQNGARRGTNNSLVIRGGATAEDHMEGGFLRGAAVEGKLGPIVVVGPEGAGIAAAELTPINLGTDWSLGDNITVYAANPDGHKAALHDGTVAVPVTAAAPTIKVSQTQGVTAGLTGDGATQMASIYGSSSGTATSKSQGIGVLGTAKNVGSEGEPDACGIYGVGRILTGGKGRAFGGFFLGRRDAVEQRATGAEIAVENLGGADSYDINTGADETKGIWLHGGTAKSACGIQVGTISEAVPSFDVVFGINKFSAATAVLQDNSAAERSLQIKGTHSKAAISVGFGSGPIVVGAEEVSTAGVMSEVYFGEEALDPGVKFGTNKGKSVSIQAIGNSTGSAKIFAANAANAFLTGSAQGDTGINFTAGKIFHIGAQTKTSLFRISETGVGFNGAVPIAKAAAIPEPALELSAERTAINEIRTVLKNVGLTA